MTTDEQWVVNAAAVQEKQATSYENAAFFNALQAFVTQQAKRRESLEGEIDGRS